MNPGELRDKAQLLQNVPTQDGMGGALQNWSVVRDMWANIKPLPRREAVEGGGLVFRQIIRLTIRAVTDITTAHRVRLSDGDYNIVGVGRAQGLETFMYLEIEKA